MRRNYLLVAEKLANIKKCFAAAKYMSPTAWKISLPDAAVDWGKEDEESEIWLEKEDDIENQAADLDNKIKPSLQNDMSKEVSQNAGEEKDAHTLNENLKNAGDSNPQPPDYPNPDDGKMIAQPINITEGDIAALLDLSERQEENDKLDQAIETLKEAISIDFDADRKARIHTKISQLERRKSKEKVYRYLTVIIFVLILIIIYLVV